jgi:hypothetical protein
MLVIVGEVTSKSITVNKIRKQHRKKKQIEIFCNHHTKLCDSVLDVKPLNGARIGGSEFKNHLKKAISRYVDCLTRIITCCV